MGGGWRYKLKLSKHCSADPPPPPQVIMITMLSCELCCCFRRLGDFVAALEYFAG
jgi:hypothetical protein